jgi:tellurite resistance protein
MFPVLIPVLVLVASAVVGVFLCLPYWRSPQKRWRDRVLALLTAASRRANVERQRLASLDAERQKRDREITEKEFQLLLSRTGVDQLDPYPGIGPGTIGSLRNAGYRSVADLRHARVRIHGLGPKRLSDIHAAVRDLIRQAQGQFEAGACPEAHSAAEQIRSSAKEFEEASYRARARIKAAETVVSQLQGPATIARRVSFRKYFWNDSQELVPRDALSAPLPNLEESIRATEERARRAFAQSMDVQATRPQSHPQVSARPVPTSVERSYSGNPMDAFPVAQPVAPPPQNANPARPAVAEPSSRTAKVSTPQQSPAVVPKHKNRWPEVVVETPKEAGPPDAHITLMELTVQVALLVARCDGRIAEKERAIIDEHLRRRYSYDSALYNRARAFASFYESAAIDVDTCLQRIAATFTAPHRAALVEFASQVAEASRGINKREAALLEKISRRLGVEPQPITTIASPKSVAPSPVSAIESPPAPAKPKPVALTREDHLAALEIDPGVPLSADLVRRQFRLLSERLSPEKFATAGVEFVSMAEQKRAAVLAAARALIAPFGEELERPKEDPPHAGLRDNPDLDAVFGV